MTRRVAKILAATIAFALGLTTSFTLGVLPGSTSVAFGFGHGGHGGGHFGGGHFGGFHGGHFGGFHGGHFGGFRGGHFGHGHFGGFHGGRFARFRGGHFRGFGHFGGRGFGERHFAHGRFGGRPFGAGRFGGGGFARANFAGNQFNHRGLGRFEGLRGFDSHGFNRNAFSSLAAWNAWGNTHWGAGWNNWGRGWGYWAGPVFWPFFYGDVLTFALWPYASYNPFFAYGPDMLMTSIFWPGPSFGYRYAYDPYYYEDSTPFDIYGYAPYVQNYAYSGYSGSRHHHRRHAAWPTTQGESAIESDTTPSCSGLAPSVTTLPIRQIERMIRPDDAQIKLVNDLEAASTQASDLLRSSCPTEIPLTPVSRLDAVAKRLGAMVEAVRILRPPLMSLYNSLDDEQKDRFAAIGMQNRERRAGMARPGSPASNLGGLCGQQATNFTLVPVQRIEETIRPIDRQKLAFDALKSASDKAARDLDASCPTEAPETLIGRLHMVARRLDALVDAVQTVKPALTDFYNSLTDEQKARFNVIGSSSRAAMP